MAITKNLLVKNLEYSRVRAVITGSQSGQLYTYFCEGSGDRFYVNQISSTASAELEAATFNAFLSFTMSGAQTYTFDLVPMEKGHSVMINTIIYSQNTDATKGFVQKSFGAWRHSGSALSCIGGSMELQTKSDFSTVGASWTASATQSIRVTFTGQTSETLDWDVHISYTKGYHDVLTGSSGPIKPIYPQQAEYQRESL